MPVTLVPRLDRPPRITEDDVSLTETVIKVKLRVKAIDIFLHL